MGVDLSSETESVTNESFFLAGSPEVWIFGALIGFHIIENDIDFAISLDDVVISFHANSQNNSP
jgi:hypothetical protein